MAFNHKGPHDRWNAGDNLNVPPHLRGKKSNGAMNNTGRSGKKVFGVILATVVVLICTGIIFRLNLIEGINGNKANDSKKAFFVSNSI